MEADLRLELEDTRRKHKEEVANLEWQLREQRALVHRLRGREKEASRQLATASKEAERVKVEREIDLKRVNELMMMLLEESEKAASEDAVAKVEHKGSGGGRAARENHGAAPD
jgi:chromosome segregation ATPase